MLRRIAVVDPGSNSRNVMDDESLQRIICKRVDPFHTPSGRFIKIEPRHRHHHSSTRPVTTTPCCCPLSKLFNTCSSAWERDRIQTSGWNPHGGIAMGYVTWEYMGCSKYDSWLYHNCVVTNRHLYHYYC